MKLTKAEKRAEKEAKKQARLDAKRLRIATKGSRKGWRDVIDWMRTQDWDKAFKLAKKLAILGREPTADERATAMLFLNATKEELERPVLPPLPAPPPKPKEPVWTGGSTMPDAWRRVKRQPEWTDPTLNPPGQPFPKIKAKKGDKLALVISKEWTIPGGVKEVRPKEGELTIFWKRKNVQDEYVWTFTYWAKMNMDSLITK